VKAYINAMEALTNKETRHLFIGKEIVVSEGNPQYYRLRGKKWYIAKIEGKFVGLMENPLESEEYKGLDFKKLDILSGFDMTLTTQQYAAHKDNDRFLRHFKILKNEVVK